MKKRPIVLSLKPQFAQLVFLGLKRAELRRRVSANVANRDVFVYVSSPVMELRGGFRVGEILRGSPEIIWEAVSEIAGVSRAVFDDYYRGQEVAFALEIRDVWQYAQPRRLQDLRESLNGFVVPQSYRYATEAECRSFRSMKTVSFPNPFVSPA